MIAVGNSGDHAATGGLVRIALQQTHPQQAAMLVHFFDGVGGSVLADDLIIGAGETISLLIGAAYFVCGMMGGSTETGVLIATWAPNVICVILGMILLRRARFR